MTAELATSLTVSEAERLLQAEALVRAFCGWHIAPSRTETVVLRGTGARTLALPSLHVTEIASVTDEGSVLALDSDYIWSAAGVITSGGYFADTAAVTVEFTHGYDEPPAEVTAVVQAIAQRGVSNPDAFTSKTIGPFSGSYAQSATSGTAIGLLESEKEILRRYRLPVVA